jgi:hypothetical protein
MIGHSSSSLYWSKFWILDLSELNKFDCFMQYDWQEITKEAAFLFAAHI